GGGAGRVAGGAHGQPHRRGGGRFGLVREGPRGEGGALPAAVQGDPRGPPRRSLRPARRRGDRHVKGTWPAVAFFALAALCAAVVRDNFLLDGLVLILLWGSTAAAWNVAGGYAGQGSLGHAAFFGL